MTIDKKATEFFILDAKEYKKRKQQAEERGVSLDYFIFEFCEIHDVKES